MNTDGYTKFILTVIAISLCVIALRPIFSPAVASAAGLHGCGHDTSHPCYVAGWGPDGTLPVAEQFPLTVLIGNPGLHPVPVVVVNPPVPMR